MTRAADEPQFQAPVADRLGYLAHMIADLEVASPDALHEAAHLAPLTGIEFPALELLADLNDEAIDAGTRADLAELGRVRAMVAARLAAERARLSGDGAGSGSSVKSPAEPRADTIARIRLAGEVMTAEALLVAAPDRFASRIAQRLHALDASRLSAREAELAGLIAGHIDSGDVGAALVVVRVLLDELGIAALAPR